MQVTFSTNRNALPAAAKPLALKSNGGLKAEKKRLYKAAKEMESLFLYHLLRSMRKTIPDGAGELAGARGGLGKEIYTQIFDQELARRVAGSTDRGLADTIYQSLVHTLEHRAGVTDGKINPVETVMPKRVYIPVKIANRNSIQTDTMHRSTDRIDTGRPPLDGIVARAAEKYSLPPELLHAVIKAESGGDPNAVSKSGAKGLMQLMDTTAVEMGVSNAFDPRENINGGARYLRSLLDRFGDLKHALAAYNAGPEAVKRYGGVPPYPETQNYVRRVMSDIPGRRDRAY
ncbi:MAG: transglycosylase SLT domain-containing protein [Candidatus Zixiibacteriota bacterium]|nr:MAG: transglycosylase SLT domain-containing protein [candidate division Zixibacteria bacterium]